jgi:hypothetical protein
MTPKNIVWLASYPKSGNTWVRFMACNLLYGRQESASGVSALIPDIHELGPQAGNFSRPGLMKTHYVHSPSLPLEERTAGVIYVLRRPEDVLVSNFHYAQRSSVLDGSRDSFDRYVDAFIANRGDPRWRGLGMGSWEENVTSWLQLQARLPVVIIRYEDLSRDAEGVCRSLAQLLRPNSTAEEIRAAADNSSFQRMREIEDSDIRHRRVGIFYKPYLQDSIETGLRFMRQGSVGDGTARLSADQRARLTAVFAPLLAKLGYAA